MQRPHAYLLCLAVAVVTAAAPRSMLGSEQHSQLHHTQTCQAPIEFLARHEIPGSATDLSRDDSPLEDEARTPSNRLGGLGSAISWTGKGNKYVMLPDRGPADGAASYKTRLHIASIDVNTTGQDYRLDVNLLETVFLTNEEGTHFVGKSDAINPSLRFDPEGICVAKTGTFFVSDEYGPQIREFDARGRVTSRTICVPTKFLVTQPHGDPAVELKTNNSGRQPNRGMEGLTLSPDGRYLIAIMQSPLIQDGALDDKGKRAGRNIRILKIDLQSQKTSEYLYQLEAPEYGVSEILALEGEKFLVLERDGKAGSAAKHKMIYQIDLSGASDISSIDRLPSIETPPGVTAAVKKPFLNLLDPRFGLVGDNFPEKVEGLTLGPNLPDGRQLLLVTSDNDFVAGIPTLIYAFAVDTSAL